MRTAAPLLAALSIACAVPTSTEPLTHEAYVWQRVWTPAVHEAVAETDMEGLAALGAEVSWVDGEPEVFRVALPDVVEGVAIRIAVPPEDVDVGVALSPLVAELSTAYPEAEMQLDMDLPTRRLSSYAGWIHALKAESSGPVVFTALPTWLGSRAFTNAARASDGFVLQVHWFDPTDPLGPLLQDDAAAAVRRAARLGVPFRVALPAYAHRVWLRGDELVGIAGEQEVDPPAGATAHTVMADPERVAALLSGWQLEHPRALTGVFWFRLPTSQDTLVWHRETLAAVRDGEPLVSGAVTDFEATDSGARNVCIRSNGSLPWTPVALSVSDASVAGGRLGWIWSPAARSFLPPAHAPTLPPGERSCVGWIRRGAPHDQ